LAVCSEVPEAGDDLEAVVGGVAASAAFPEILPVFESGDSAVVTVAEDVALAGE
jgi:hypothetical protein